MSTIRVVHYLNQFFVGLGAEAHAGTGPGKKGGVVGPGIALQQALGECAQVVATVYCGDNYANERADAIVCIGSRDRKVTLPPTPKVIGGRRLASSDADPRGELTVNVRDIHTACSNQGFGRQTTRFY